MPRIPGGADQGYRTAPQRHRLGDDTRRPRPCSARKPRAKVPLWGRRCRLALARWDPGEFVRTRLSVVLKLGIADAGQPGDPRRRPIQSDQSPRRGAAVLAWKAVDRVDLDDGGTAPGRTAAKKRRGPATPSGPRQRQGRRPRPDDGTPRGAIMMTPSTKSSMSSTAAPPSRGFSRRVRAGGGIVAAPAGRRVAVKLIPAAAGSTSPPARR